MDEVHAVIEYINKLLMLQEKGRKVTQTDIGVVVPYKLQSKIIRRVCDKMGYDGITIGTSETFQGQEKPIMIVSTVRSDGNLGFLNDPRVSLLCHDMISVYIYFFILNNLYTVGMDHLKYFDTGFDINRLCSSTLKLALK